MESASKRKWKKDIEESTPGKGRKISPTGNRSGGTSSSSKQKGKSQGHALVTTEITPQNIAFEGLSSMKCRKILTGRAKVEWAIRMLIFCICNYEGFLCTMIEAYDRASRRSSFPYLERDLVVSFKAADFIRVFDIPGPQGKKVEPRKISKEVKMFLIRLVCEDMAEAEQEVLTETSKGRGLKKTNIQEGLG